jgi:peptidoglycan/xylan/chitin deacetylase (PgdA/CDA1 family)
LFSVYERLSIVYEGASFMHITSKQSIPLRHTFPFKGLLASLLVLVLAGLALGVHLYMMNSVAPVEHTAVQEQVERAAPGGGVAEVAAQTLATSYMQALLTQHYSAMWSLLAPQVQAMWPDETTFGTFWQAKFQDYTLQRFTLGKAQALSSWVNPETMVTYDQVEELPISLQLTLKQAPSAMAAALVPPEDLQPDALFSNVPFIVQYMADSSGVGGNWRVLKGGPADLEAPILPPLTPVARSLPVPILMYHHISDAPTYNVLDRSLTVTPDMFSQQLDYLKAQGYHSITLNQLMNALYYGGPLPDKPIVLTFDDGYEDNYHFAYGILRDHGYSGMFYIITGKVGWAGQMTWGELHDMLNHGMQIGSHTIHHVDIGAVLLDSLTQAQQELQISQQTLEQNLGIPIQHFCYPNGQPFKTGSVALRQRVVALLASEGYISATTDPGPTGIVQQSLSPFVLLRVRVDGRELLSAFEQSI